MGRQALGGQGRPPPKGKVVLPHEEEKGALEALLVTLTRENTNELPPIEGRTLQEAVRRLTRRKAQGLDHWTVEQLQCLPAEAWPSMAAILNRIEEIGEWPWPWSRAQGENFGASHCGSVQTPAIG